MKMRHLLNQVDKYLAQKNYQYILDPVRLSTKYHKWPAPMLHELGVTVRHEAADSDPDSSTLMIPRRYVEGVLTEPIVTLRGFYAEPIKRYNYLGVCLSLIVQGVLDDVEESFDFVTLEDINYLTDSQIGSILHWAELFLNMKLEGRTRRNENCLQLFRKKYKQTKRFDFSHERFFLSPQQKINLTNNNRPMIPKLIAEDNTWNYVNTENMSNVNLINEHIYDPYQWSDTYNSQVFLASSLNNFNQVTFAKKREPIGYFDYGSEYGNAGGNFEFDTIYMLQAVCLGMFVTARKENLKPHAITLLHLQKYYDEIDDPTRELDNDEKLIGAGIDFAVKFLKDSGVSLLPRSIKPLYNKWLSSCQ